MDLSEKLGRILSGNRIVMPRLSGLVYRMVWWQGIRLQENDSGTFQAKEANVTQNERSIFTSASIQQPFGCLM